VHASVHLDGSLCVAEVALRRYQLPVLRVERALPLLRLCVALRRQRLAPLQRRRLLV
jgi:hypothetical protein